MTVFHLATEPTRYPSPSHYTACGLDPYTSEYIDTKDPEQVTCKRCLRVMAARAHKDDGTEDRRDA